VLPLVVIFLFTGRITYESILHPADHPFISAKYL
jgi:hypothetical protein